MLAETIIALDAHERRNSGQLPANHQMLGVSMTTPTGLPPATTGARTRANIRWRTFGAGGVRGAVAARYGVYRDSSPCRGVTPSETSIHLKAAVQRIIPASTRHRKRSAFVIPTVIPTRPKNEQKSADLGNNDFRATIYAANY